jgi:hypothetical protein
MKKVNFKNTRNILIVTIALFSYTLQAQNNTSNSVTREGFMFEFTLGGGIITVEDSFANQSVEDTQGGISFPDLKFGYMLNEKFAVTLSLPGMIYKENDNDRHFGGIIPSVQYWLKDRWWVHGGAGLALDSPALYDIDSSTNSDWNTGLAGIISTGYEVYHNDNFALNIQTKVLVGGVKINNEIDRGALQFSIGVGFNWF